MKRRAIKYSDAELFWIADNRHLPRRELHREFVEIWDRPDVSQDHLASLCKRKGWLTGRTGRFDKGHEPANKGRKGYSAPGCEKGWFKKGERQGRANRNYKPIGTERISDTGYIERKIHDGLPLQSRWRAVHLIRWEEANGPLPEGHVLKCLDGDRTNTDPANWKCIPRSMLPRLSGRWTTGYDDAPAELKPTLMATAELEQAVRKVRKAGSDRK